MNIESTSATHFFQTRFNELPLKSDNVSAQTEHSAAKPEAQPGPRDHLKRRASAGIDYRSLIGREESRPNLDELQKSKKKTNHYFIQLNSTNQKVMEVFRQKLEKNIVKSKKSDKIIYNTRHNIKCFLSFLEQENILFSSVNFSNINFIIEDFRKSTSKGNCLPQIFYEIFEEMLLDSNRIEPKSKQMIEDETKIIVNKQYLKQRVNALPEDEKKFFIRFLENSCDGPNVLTNKEMKAVLDFMDDARSLTEEKAIIFAKDYSVAAQYLLSAEQQIVLKSFLNFCDEQEDELVSLC